MVNKSAQSLGKLGGQATKKKLGSKHFSEAGKLGMAKRWAKPNPPISPTVEKWGGDQESNKCEFCGETKPVQRYYLRVKNKHFDDNKGGCYSTFIYYCQDCGVEDTLSVQEAKAEERQVMITKLHNIRSKIHGYISLIELTDLLASLKQEEEKA